MRRSIIGCAAAALSLLGASVVVSSTAAHATTEHPEQAPVEGHGVVGAWMVTFEEFPDAPTLSSFHADGTFEEAEPDGSTAVGVWEATGATTFNLTLIQTGADDEGTFQLFSRIRASGEVSADGQTFTAEFTIEFLAEGFPEGEIGPGHVTGTRINVEPMGTPAGSFDDAFGQLEEGTEPAPEDTEAAVAASTEAAPATTS